MTESAARILGVEAASIPLDALKESTHNPRRGDVKAIQESLAANGQFRPLV